MNEQITRELITIGHTEYSLRPVTINDSDTLHNLDMLCFRPDRAFTSGYFLLLFHYDGAFGWALEANEEIIAFILVTRRNRSANIATIDVHPDYRRKGLAKVLMEYAEARIAEDGATSWTLQVETDNHAAITLYHEFGFAFVREIPNYYDDADAYLMKKLIS